MTNILDGQLWLQCKNHKIMVYGHAWVHRGSTLISSLPRSTVSKKVCATESRASRGHSVNQSMVQQFTREGNMRQRARKASPTGLMHRTMCKWFCTLPMK